MHQHRTCLVTALATIIAAPTLCALSGCDLIRGGCAVPPVCTAQEGYDIDPNGDRLPVVPGWTYLDATWFEEDIPLDVAADGSLYGNGHWLTEAGRDPTAILEDSRARNITHPVYALSGSGADGRCFVDATTDDPPVRSIECDLVTASQARLEITIATYAQDDRPWIRALEEVEPGVWMLGATVVKGGMYGEVEAVLFRIDTVSTPASVQPTTAGIVGELAARGLSVRVSFDIASADTVLLTATDESNFSGDIPVRRMWELVAGVWQPIIVPAAHTEFLAHTLPPKITPAGDIATINRPDYMWSINLPNGDTGIIVGRPQLTDQVLLIQRRGGTWSTELYSHPTLLVHARAFDLDSTGTVHMAATVTELIEEPLLADGHANPTSVGHLTFDTAGQWQLERVVATGEAAGITVGSDDLPRIAHRAHGDWAICHAVTRVYRDNPPYLFHNGFKSMIAVGP